MGLSRVIGKLIDKKASFSVSFDDTSSSDKVTICIHTGEEIIFCTFEDGEVAWYSEEGYVKILNMLL